MVVCFADVGGLVDHLIVIFTFILKRPSYVQQECKSKNTTAKWNTMKKKTQKYHAVPNINIKIVERDKIDTPNTQIHDHSLSWLGTGLVTIPLTHKYMTANFPGLVQAW